MNKSAFERYGGFAKINRVVGAFYDQVLDNPNLSHYFANTDMKRQISHQTKFIASLMGGPASYSNEELERAHARFQIDAKAFDEMLGLLRETLEDYEFADEDIDEVVGNFTARRRFIVNS